MIACRAYIRSSIHVKLPRSRSFNQLFPSGRMFPLSRGLLLDFTVLSEDRESKVSRAVSRRVLWAFPERMLRVQALSTRREMRGNLSQSSVSNEKAEGIHAIQFRSNIPEARLNFSPNSEKISSIRGEGNFHEVLDLSTNHRLLVDIAS